MLRTSLSLAMGILVGGAAWAQSSGEGENSAQLPVGQTFKQFTYPVYQEGKLKATLSAVTAIGITLNRAETTDLKIDLYDDGAVTTTVTSPDADLYVSEQKMRTKNTVLIERADMTATAQTCDFDLKTKKYILRNKVTVLLKHFDLGTNPANGAAPTPASNHAASPPSPAPANSSDSLLESPGSASAAANSSPQASPTSDTK